MADDFENHCWKDVVPPDVLDIYTHYARKTFVGPSPALLAIDLYELAYQGGAKPVAELHKTYPELLRRERLCRDRADQAAVCRGARGRHPDLLHHAGHPAGQRADPRHRDQAAATCRAIPRSTPSGPSSSRSPATSSSPSSAPAASTARRCWRI